MRMAEVAQPATSGNPLDFRRTGKPDADPAI